MKTHELKIWPKYYVAVLAGHKTFEVRKNDRDFSFGDSVLLREWDPHQDYVDYPRDKSLKEPKGYTGNQLMFQIGFIYELPEPKGYVVFSLLKPDEI